MRRDGTGLCLPGHASEPEGSGRFAGKSHRSDDRWTFRRDRVVPPMPVAAAGFSFFLNVGDFAAGGQFAISTKHAPTTESSEAEKPNETHRVLRFFSIAL